MCFSPSRSPSPTKSARSAATRNGSEPWRTVIGALCTALQHESSIQLHRARQTDWRCRTYGQDSCSAAGLRSRELNQANALVILQTVNAALTNKSEDHSNRVFADQIFSGVWARPCKR